MFIQSCYKGILAKKEEKTERCIHILNYLTSMFWTSSLSTDWPLYREQFSKGPTIYIPIVKCLTKLWCLSICESSYNWGFYLKFGFEMAQYDIQENKTVWSSFQLNHRLYFKWPSVTNKTCFPNIPWPQSLKMIPRIFTSIFVIFCFL